MNGTDRVPVLTVIGRVNEGKSSIVATLTENESVPISPEPGTTTRCHRYDMTVDGRLLFSIVDTPGFQQPELMLAWMEQRASSAAERPDAVRRFFEHYQGSGEFEDECELLKPILEGAHILYVVDSSHPYRPNFEAEMEILRWTGRPRMALINRIGDEDYTSDWTRALGQYFNIVRIFDAHSLPFEDRIALLTTLKEIDPELAGALANIIRALTDLHETRIRDSSRVIARLIADSLTFTVQKDLPPERDRTETERMLLADYQDGLRRLEERARRDIQTIFRYEKLERREDPVGRPVYSEDLFAEVTWRMLGLSTARLITMGTLTTAAVGGGIDLAVGGHSLMAGTLIGGIIGALSTGYAAYRSPEARVLGQAIAGKVLRVGPNRNPRLGWIILDRALLHYAAVSNRTHAQRDPLDLDAQKGKTGIVAGFSQHLSRDLSSMLSKVSRPYGSEVAESELADRISEVLKTIG